ncbi:MAG TPA: DUF6491 family protein [Allosphingosinicella sp.]|jgi:hypothetical protein
MNNRIIATLAAAASLGAVAPAAAEPADEAAIEEEVRVPFLHVGRFRTFRATDQRTLYIRATNRQWYRVTTMGPCPNLPWARAIGIDNRGVTLDRFSTLIVEDDRCPVQSVVRTSAPPPRRTRRGH